MLYVLVSYKILLSYLFSIVIIMLPLYGQ